eukprot:gene29740-35912_t
MIGLKRQKTFDIVPEHLISVRDLSMAFISLLLDVADEMKTLVSTQGGDDRLKYKVLAAVFYEPSTRTSCSFQAAMLRLGGSVITLNEDSSSVKKGESLEDTIQTMSCYCDLIVLRHPAQGSAALAASVSAKSVVNAGDGTGEHPTQALLDIYTIKSELGYLGGTAEQPMVITFLGDLKHGRTVHSLALLVAMYGHVKLIYVHPPNLGPPESLVQEVSERGGIQVTGMSLEEAIAISDVLYVTRIQKERFLSTDSASGCTEADYERVAGSYVVNPQLMQRAKQNMVVMHPLPRLTEIDRAVDLDPRAAYFRQMENGMYVRMALLSLMMNK